MNLTSSAPDDPYRRIAAFYDLEHLSFRDDVDFYIGFVEAVGDPILELGCGSGRLLVPLASAGYRVTGLDRSCAMLERAQERTDDEGLDSLITLFEGDLDNAPRAPGGPFGVAIIALNGFLHLTTAIDQRGALQAIHGALDPRGQLLIDVLNPSPELLRSFDHAFTHEGAWTEPDGTRVDKFAARRLSPATQTIHTELWYDQTSPDGTVRRIATNYDLRYVHRAELELMLELAGFAEWQVYGSYELDPFDDGAERLIVAAEVTPSR
jgi:SAM-dependent methyltransferase